MRGKLYKKGLVVGIIFLFFGLAIFPSTGVTIIKKSVNKMDNGTTLYVGGGGPNNYTSIQDAIDNSSDGDIVFVYSGTYLENVVIHTNISLMGEDKNTTIIHGQGKDNVVSITHEYVTVSGFTLQKGKYLLAGINLGSHYNTIKNNIFINNTFGIICDHSYHNIILYNTFERNSFAGIKLRWGRNNNISYNSFINNGDEGIKFTDVSKYNVISYNYITENGAGIKFWDSQENTITRNIIYKNGQGIHFYKSKSNVIFENNITDGSKGLHFITDSSDNIIYHNNLISNGENGYDTNSYNNQYDNGETGNYWDDYKEKNPYAYKIYDKGIWSEPYHIGDNKDRYPLIQEWPKSANYNLNSNERKDCIECQISEEYSNLKVKMLFNRIKMVNNFLSLLSDVDQEIIPDFPLSDRPLCDILEELHSHYLKIARDYMDLFWDTGQSKYFWLSFGYTLIVAFYFEAYYALNCGELL